jgi:cupin domain
LECRGRRIVPGVDAQGRSVVVSDQPIIAADASADKPARADFWVARQLPTPLDGQLEPLPDWKGGNQALPGGVVGRLLTWPAGFSYRRHTTPTIHFIIVVSGQLELVLDTETRVLSAGDAAVQRGTAHAWRVVGLDPCTFVGVMLDAAVPI